MTKPTSKEITAEVTRLKAMRSNVRPKDVFGGDNLAQLDAQVETMEQDLSIDDIYDREGGEWDSDEVSAAIGARSWMDGEDETNPPSEDWEPLTHQKELDPAIASAIAAGPNHFRALETTVGTENMKNGVVPARFGGKPVKPTVKKRKAKKS